MLVENQSQLWSTYYLRVLKKDKILGQTWLLFKYLQDSAETQQHLQWFTVIPKKQVKSPRVTCHVHNQQEDLRSPSSFSATDEHPDTPPRTSHWCLHPYMMQLQQNRVISLGYPNSPQDLWSCLQAKSGHRKLVNLSTVEIFGGQRKGAEQKSPKQRTIALAIRSLAWPASQSFFWECRLGWQDKRMVTAAPTAIERCSEESET